MKIRQRHFIILYLATLLLSAAANAQISAGGNSSGNGLPKDSNAWNPSNWQITYSKSGQDVVSSWILQNGFPFNLVTTLSWSQPIQSTGATNSTGQVRTGTMSSQGTNTINLQWIGIGAAPQKVLVKISADAMAGTTPAGSFTMENGIDSEIETWYDTVFTVWKIAKPKLNWVSIDGSGHAVMTLNKNVFATVASTNDLSAFASARNTGMAIASRAVTVSGNPSPTYHHGYHDMPFINKNDDPHSIVMDIGATVDDNGFGFAWADMIGGLWGPWNNPIGAWQWSHNINTDWLVAGYRKYFTQSEIASLINSPIEVTNTISVHDDDGISDSATIKIRVHAPHESPVLISDNRKYDQWSRVSPLYQGLPSQTVNITQSMAYSEAVTKTISVGGKVILPNDPIVNELNFSASYAETTTVTLLNGVTYPAGPDSTRRFWLEKRNFWRELNGFCLGYGQNGYVGLQDIVATKWESATSTLASQNDHEYRLQSEPIS